MGHDVVIVGGGTAGCVLAARLSENPDRSVCLLEAGPDYGPLEEGRWPREIVDATRMPGTHDWGPGGEDERTLGARVLGGCSAHNECVVLQGSPADYDEWGDAWAYDRFATFLERARATLRTAPRNTDRPAPFFEAFVDAAVHAGHARLSDPDDPACPVGIAPYPANVVDGKRWNAAFAYLDRARERPNLTIADRTLVDRLVVDGSHAVGVVSADGRRFEAETIVVAAGAYFSPAILCRSGIGPERELLRHGIRTVGDLPVGERLLDHCGTSVGWEPSPDLRAALEKQEAEHTLFDAHVVLKAASSACAPDTWDLHVLPVAGRDRDTGAWDVRALFFHMKPLSRGRLRLRSADPADLPVVERGFLREGGDLTTLREGLDLVRAFATTHPLSTLLGDERRPGDEEPERFLRETTFSYFHPAGTCPIGEVVDSDGRVLGVEGLVVADASIMPTIPRANTNLTTAAIAERIATTFGS
jgi:choline dehydrogenase